MKIKMDNISDELDSIIEKYNKKLCAELGFEYDPNEREPLDGDEVDRLVLHLKNEIDLNEGNITNYEYEELEAMADE